MNGVFMPAPAPWARMTAVWWFQSAGLLADQITRRGPRRCGVQDRIRKIREYVPPSRCPGELQRRRGEYRADAPFRAAMRQDSRPHLYCAMPVGRTVQRNALFVRQTRSAI